MTDTQYKSLELEDELLGLPTEQSVLWPAPLTRAPYLAALRPPGTLGAARRLVGGANTGGSTEFYIPSTTPPGSPDYPTPDEERVVARSAVHLIPGNWLRARVIYTPSGALVDDFGPGPEYVGGGGGFEIEANYTAPDSSTDGPNVTETSFIASGLADHAEWTGFGGLWSTIRHELLPDVSLSGYPADPSEQSTFGEWSEVDLELRGKGGARVLSVSVQEVPRRHVIAHDETESTSHDWPLEFDPQPPRPTEKAVDGASYEEHRFGVLRSLIAARRQADKIGPMICFWSAYTEKGQAIGDTEATTPITITSTSFVNIHDQSETAWHADNPGYLVPGYYAQRWREHSTLRHGAAVIPVRFFVWASKAGAGGMTGQIKAQATARSMVVHTITPTTSIARYEWTGYLESMRHPDDLAATSLQILGLTSDVSNGLEIWQYAIAYGHDCKP